MEQNTTAVNRMGTVVQQTGITRLIPSTEKPDVSYAIARPHLAEDSFTLQTLVAKENQVANFVWTSADTLLKVEKLLKIPQDLLTTNAVSGPFVLASYARLGARVRVQSSGIGLAQGALIVYYMPYTSLNAMKNDTGAAGTTHWTDNMVTLSCMQHAILQANGPDSVEIEIDFKQVRGYLRLNNPDATDFIGYLGISVLGVLSASGTTGIPVNVYSQFVDAGYFIPAPSGVTFRRMNDSAVSRDSYWFKAPRRWLKRLAGISDEAEFDQGVGEAGFVGGLISKFLGGMNPKEMLMDGISSLLDKPAMTQQVLPQVRHYAPILGNGIGVDVADRFDLSPSSQSLCMKEHFGSKVDEMNLKRIASRPAIYGAYNWNSQANNVILAAGQVCPYDFGISGGGTGQKAPLVVGSVFSPTYLDYVAMPFSFWRGGITFKIMIFNTKFHGGKLLFAFHAQESVPPTDYEESSGQYNVSMDLSSGLNTWTFTVPFRAPTPYLKVPNGHLQGASTTIFDYVTGCWSLRVQNQLVTNATVANNVDFLIWQSGAEDIEFGGLYGNNLSVMPFNDVPWVEPAVPPMEDEIDEGVGEAGVVGESADGTANGSPPELQVGDKVVDVEASAGGTEAPASSETATFNTFPDMKIAATNEMTWGDWHFGWKGVYMNARNLMKRYVKVFSGVLPTSNGYGTNGVDYAMQIVLALKNSPMRESSAQDLIGYKIPAITLPTIHINPTNPCGGYSKGIISHFSDIFRFWRGSMNYKIMFTGPSTTQPMKVFAIFIPEIIQRSFRPVFAPSSTSPGVAGPSSTGTLSQFIEDYVGRMVVGIGNIGVQTTNISVGAELATASVHVAFADWSAGVLEIQVPYASHYAVRICGLDTACLSDGTTAGNQVMPAGLDNSAGTVFIGTISPSGWAGVSTIGAGMHVYQSVGDDFAMGCLLPPPPTMVVNGTLIATVGETNQYHCLYPDNYAPVTEVPIGRRAVQRWHGVGA